MTLAVVQGTANTAFTPSIPSTPTATFPSPCANGNLIVVLAMTFATQGPALGGSGFTLDSFDTSGVTGMNIGLYYAYLGAGGLTVLPFDGTNRQYWACSAWELSGSTGVWATDKVAVTFNAAAALYPSTGPYTTTSFNTFQSNELVLGAITGNSGASNASFASSAYTTDATDVSAGNAFCSALALHVAVPVSGTSISTVVSWTGGGGTNSEYAFVELNAASANTETADVEMDLNKVSFAGVVSKAEIGDATFQLTHVSFNTIVAVTKVTAAVMMSLDGVTILSGTFDLSALSPLRQFATFS